MHSNRHKTCAQPRKDKYYFKNKAVWTSVVFIYLTIVTAGVTKIRNFKITVLILWKLHVFSSNSTKQFTNKKKTVNIDLKSIIYTFEVNLHTRTQSRKIDYHLHNQNNKLMWSIQINLQHSLDILHLLLKFFCINMKIS